jgi:hypothetical protein
MGDWSMLAGGFILAELVGLHTPSGNSTASVFCRICSAIIVAR